MAWTTPPTFASSTTATAADANILSADLAYLKLLSEAAQYMAVQVTRNANQSIPDTTSTAISWDTQQFDLGGAWSSGTNVVIPAGWLPAGVAGIGVRVTCRTFFATSSTGRRTMSFLLNGAEFASIVQVGIAGGSTALINVDVAPDCVAGDIITVEVAQTSGGALNMVGTLTVERAGTTS